MEGQALPKKPMLPLLLYVQELGQESSSGSSLAEVYTAGGGGKKKTRHFRPRKLMRKFLSRKQGGECSEEVTLCS